MPPSTDGFPEGGRRRALSFAAAFVFIAVWETTVRTGLLPSVLVPPPSGLIDAFRREAANGCLWESVSASLSHWCVGTLVGSALGILFGGVAAANADVEAALEGVARFLRPISPIAWIPFAIIWFGVSDTAAAFLIVTGVFWINYFATMTAVRSIDPAHLELARAFGQGRLPRLIVKVILPAAAPGILSGLRGGLSMSWFVVPAAELFGARGIGQRMMEASGFLATDVVLLHMVVISLLYTVFDVALARFARKVTRWML